MRDGFLIQTLPFFRGALAFLPGCSPTTKVDDTNGTDATGSASMTMTTTEGSESTTEDPTTSSSTMSTTATTTETMTTAVDTTETGDPQCGGGTCVAPVEDGWFGPTVFARLPLDGELPSCTPEFPDAGPTLLEGYQDPGPATCDCSCELQMAPNCNGQMVSYSTANCGTWLESIQVSANCTNINITSSARFSTYGYGVGICDETEIEDIPPVPWDATIRTCRVPENALTCDTGVCLPQLPEGFEANWCMYRQGDFECPAGEYANKSLFWSGAEDSRACSNCTCGTAGTNCNDSQADVFAGADCEGNPVATLNANQCTNVTGLSVAGTFGATEACPVMTPPEPMGTVAPMGEFTFCCAN